MQKFVYALTQGGSTGQMFRAIDLLAHDPCALCERHAGVDAPNCRFGSGVLGSCVWPAVCQPLQSSSDSSEGTGEQGGDEMRTEGEVGGGKRRGAACSLRARAWEASLRVRVVQTLEANGSVETLYALADLLAFYESTFRRLINGENAIHSTAKGCMMECRRLFGMLLKRQSDALHSGPAHFPIDLSATHACTTCAKQVREVVKVSKTTLSQCCYDPTDELHVNVVLGHLIQPNLVSCRTGASGLDKADVAVLMLNNISTLIAALTGIGYDYSDIPVVPHAPPASSASEEETYLRISPPADGLAPTLSEEADKWVTVLEQEEAHKALGP